MQNDTRPASSPAPRGTLAAFVRAMDTAAALGQPVYSRGGWLGPVWVARTVGASESARSGWLLESPKGGARAELPTPKAEEFAAHPEPGVFCLRKAGIEYTFQRPERFLSPAEWRAAVVEHWARLQAEAVADLGALGIRAGVRLLDRWEDQFILRALGFMIQPADSAAPDTFLALYCYRIQPAEALEMRARALAADLAAE